MMNSLAIHLIPPFDPTIWSPSPISHTPELRGVGWPGDAGHSCDQRSWSGAACFGAAMPPNHEKSEIDKRVQPDWLNIIGFIIRLNMSPMIFNQLTYVFSSVVALQTIAGMGYTCLSSNIPSLQWCSFQPMLITTCMYLIGRDVNQPSVFGSYLFHMAIVGPPIAAASPKWMVSPWQPFHHRGNRLAASHSPW